jgi:hypothetical protein
MFLLVTEELCNISIGLGVIKEISDTFDLLSKFTF